jgi:hypothetical protein
MQAGDHLVPAAWPRLSHCQTKALHPALHVKDWWGSVAAPCTAMLLTGSASRSSAAMLPALTKPAWYRMSLDADERAAECAGAVKHAPQRNQRSLGPSNASCSRCDCSLQRRLNHATIWCGRVGASSAVVHACPGCRRSMIGEASQQPHLNCKHCIAGVAIVALSIAAGLGCPTHWHRAQPSPPRHWSRPAWSAIY